MRIFARSAKSRRKGWSEFVSEIEILRTGGWLQSKKSSIILRQSMNLESRSSRLRI
jgi:hypothetical protein